MENSPFENLIAVFDQILVSDNPAVQAALQNLMLLAALSNTSKDGPGPITEMFRAVEELKREVDQLRTEIRIMGASKAPNYPNYPSPYSPSWPGDIGGVGIRPGTREWDEFMKWGAKSQTTSNTSGFNSSSSSKADALLATSAGRRKKDLDKYTSVLERMREKMAKK